MQAIPGPDTMLVVSRGLGQGRRIAVWTAVGAVSAGIVQLPLLAAGVAALVESSPTAFYITRYAGAAFLVVLGLRLLLQQSATNDIAVGSAKTSSLRAFFEGMIANLTNPNVIVFMLAFLPQFVEPSTGSVGVQMLVLGAIQKATGLFVLGGTALLAGGVGDWIAKRPSWLLGQKRFAGCALIALGIGAALSGSVRTQR
jgi:threonine/homoserine/homoserine lactone efflux protein